MAYTFKRDHCAQCGQFISYTNCVSYTPHGNANHLEPPDEEFECLRCWDGQEQKWRDLTRRIAYGGVRVMRNGKAHD